MVQDRDLVSRMAGMSDAALCRVLAVGEAEYRPDALVIARDELSRREHLVEPGESALAMPTAFNLLRPEEKRIFPVHFLTNGTGPKVLRGGGQLTVYKTHLELSVDRNFGTSPAGILIQIFGGLFGLLAASSQTKRKSVTYTYEHFLGAVLTSPLSLQFGFTEDGTTLEKVHIRTDTESQVADIVDILSCPNHHVEPTTLSRRGSQ